ncbi:hypothetical protein CHS0354_018789 [Potamilus streckersoni]|uniref:Uncharacterized protein n=1 Tax=Potamilus streckersoni TaxID=2493646 RepID=A0AAE0WBC1_9BIVA|nr:hypothetical protein CHS0354_018789 [Potamilus streckersoni]
MSALDVLACMIGVAIAPSPGFNRFGNHGGGFYGYGISLQTNTKSALDILACMIGVAIAPSPVFNGLGNHGGGFYGYEMYSGYGGRYSEYGGYTWGRYG